METKHDYIFDAIRTAFKDHGLLPDGMTMSHLDKLTDAMNEAARNVANIKEDESDPLFDIETVVEEGILTQEELDDSLELQCDNARECFREIAYTALETEINSAESEKDLRERLHLVDEFDEEDDPFFDPMGDMMGKNE